MFLETVLNITFRIELFSRKTYLKGSWKRNMFGFDRIMILLCPGLDSMHV